MLYAVLTMSAQNTIGELFKTMPDSLMPLLTKNNRLDMIDFMEAKMKACVVNRLESESEMTELTADSLCIQLSNVQQVRIYLVPTTEPYDSCQQVICMQNTFLLISSGLTESTYQFFTVRWNPLDSRLFDDHRRNRSSILRQDEQVFKTTPIM